MPDARARATAGAYSGRVGEWTAVGGPGDAGETHHPRAATSRLVRGVHPQAARVGHDVRTEERVETGTADLADGWTTVVWNDPVNLMSYVTYVFRSYFGYPTAKAETLMRQVHTQGRATVSRGNREQMEVDVQAMHLFGLWATVQSDQG